MLMVIRKIIDLNVPDCPRPACSEDGFPLSYSIFNGSQYEGRTMIPIIEDFVQRFHLTDFVVVADSGLMSARNVKLLEDAGYKYILGARIRSESPVINEWMLSLNKKTDSNVSEYAKEIGQRLIVSYSDLRARKSAWNRDKDVERLRKAYAKGTLTKENVNKRGYNKFLEISKDIMVRIDEDKILEVAKTITTIKIRLPNGSMHSETLFTTPQQKALKPLLDSLARNTRA